MDYARFATTIGEFFLDVAEQLGDYIDDTVTDKDDPKVDQLEGQLDKMSDYAQQFFNLSDRIAFADLETYVPGVIRATGVIQEDLRVIASVDKAIAIAGCVVDLGFAVIGKDGAALGRAIKAVSGV